MANRPRLRYLSVDEVIALQVAVMERGGWLPAPLVNRERLESAMMRAEAAAFYEEADLVRQAATLGVGISQAQAFLDGNKRAAFAALDVFLRINQSQFVGDAVALGQQLVTIAQRLALRKLTMSAAVDELEVWLREYTSVQ